MAWFSLTNNKKEIDGKTIYQIKYIKKIEISVGGSVGSFKKNAGDLGGWIETEENLSQDYPVVLSEKTIVLGKDTRIKTNGVVFDSTIIDSQILSEKAGILCMIRTHMKNMIVWTENAKAIIINSKIKGIKNNSTEIYVKSQNKLNEHLLFIVDSSLIVEDAEEENRYGEKVIFVENSAVRISNSTIKFPKETTKTPICATEESNISIFTSKIFYSYLNAKKSKIEINNSGFFKTTDISNFGNGDFRISHTLIKRTKNNLSRNVFRARLDGKIFVEDLLIEGSATFAAYDSYIDICHSIIKGSPMIVSSERTHIEKSEIIGKSRIKDSSIINSKIYDNCKVAFMQIKDSTIKGDSNIGFDTEGRETRVLREICLSNLNINNTKDFVIVTEKTTMSKNDFAAYRTGPHYDNICVIRILRPNEYIKAEQPYDEITRIKNRIIAFSFLSENEFTILSNIKGSIANSLKITESQNKKTMELYLIVFWIDCLIDIWENSEKRILEEMLPIVMSRNLVDIKTKTMIIKNSICVFPKYANELLPKDKDIMDDVLIIDNTPRTE